MEGSERCGKYCYPADMITMNECRSCFTRDKNPADFIKLRKHKNKNFRCIVCNENFSSSNNALYRNISGYEICHRCF